MAVYLLYVISPVFVAGLVRLFSNKPLSDEKNKNRCIVLCAIIMMLMVGLRHYGNGSGDSKFYYDLWEKIAKMDFGSFRTFMENTDMEGGFLISNFLLTRIFKDSQFAFILSGLFFAISTGIFVKRNCREVILPFIIFNSLGLFNFMVQGMRQAVAMCICLFAYEMAKKRKIIWFALLIALAATFHASAVVFAVTFFIGFFRFNLPSISAYLAGSILGVILLPDIFELVNVLMNEDYEFGVVEDESSRIITIIIHLAIILFGLVFYDSRKKENEYSSFIYMAILCAEMFVLRSSASNIIERISFYFMFAQMVVVPNALYNITNRRTKVFFYMLIVGLFFGLAVHKTSYSNLIPYEFMWK